MNKASREIEGRSKIYFCDANNKHRKYKFIDPSDEILIWSCDFLKSSQEPFLSSRPERAKKVIDSTELVLIQWCANQMSKMPRFFCLGSWRRLAVADFFPSPIISRLAVGQKNFDSSLSLILSSYLFLRENRVPSISRREALRKGGGEWKIHPGPKNPDSSPLLLAAVMGIKNGQGGEGDKEDTFFGRRHLNGLQAPPAQKDGGMGEWGIRPRMPRISLCVLRG